MPSLFFKPVFNYIFFIYIAGQQLWCIAIATLKAITRIYLFTLNQKSYGEKILKKYDTVEMMSIRLLK